MQFRIRHLLWLMAGIGFVFAISDRIQVARRAHRAEAHYSFAKFQNDEMRAYLDRTAPNWRNEIAIEPKFENLPEPAAWTKDARPSASLNNQ